VRQCVERCWNFGALRSSARRLSDSFFVLFWGLHLGCLPWPWLCVGEGFEGGKRPVWKIRTDSEIVTAISEIVRKKKAAFAQVINKVLFSE